MQIANFFLTKITLDGQMTCLLAYIESLPSSSEDSDESLEH